MIGECKRCGGSGLICVERKTGAEVYGKDVPLIFTEPCPECNGGHEVKVQKVKQRANIPPSFYEATLESFELNAYLDDKNQVIDLSQQRKFVESFVNDFMKWEERGLGLYLWSSIRGTGKTFLASCICNELMKRTPIVTKFVSACELIKMNEEDRKRNFTKPQIDILCECNLLVIDDLGQQKTGENYVDDILFRIIDYRYQHKLVTIVTSNIKLANLRLDDRVTDRLNKMCQPVPLPDFSFRQKENVASKKEFLKEMGLM